MKKREYQSGHCVDPCKYEKENIEKKKWEEEENEEWKESDVLSHPLYQCSLILKFQREN